MLKHEFCTPVNRKSCMSDVIGNMKNT